MAEKSGPKVGSWMTGGTSQAMAGVGRAGFIRDPSGLLMSIIRTLASSGDDDYQREHEKERLEEAFSETDQQLDELVADNYEEVAVSIKQFGKIGDRISESCARIKKVKESLQQCKSLLYCRQDELRKLWVEGVEHKKVLFLLDQVERVKEAPLKIESYLSQKYYLHATELLLQTQNALNADLIKVEALHDIKNELLAKKMTLHERFISELHQQIYINSITPPAINEQAVTKPKFTKKRDEKAIEDDGNNIGKFDARVLELENLNVNPEQDTFKLITVLIESLSRLKKIPDAVEAIKTRMDRYINEIVTHATIEVTDMAFENDSKDPDSPKRLLELLQSLFKKFHAVVSAHQHALSALKRLGVSLSPEVSLYDIEEVWAKVQSVIQLLLHEYLDADNVAATTQQISGLGFSEGGSLSSYFSRKKASRQRDAKLFRFDGSSHAISMNNYLREQRAQRRSHSFDGNGSSLLDHALSTQKVCKPNPRNITILFAPLKKFIQEIESSLKYTGSKRCSLNDYITDYVQDVFIRQIQYELKKDFDTAMKVTDPLKVLADANVHKNLFGNYKSLLQSTVVTNHCMWFLYDLTCSLDSYHDHFLTMACSLLQEYKEMSSQSYRGVVQPESEDHRIYSASWVRQNDVNEFLQKMDSWKVAYGTVLPKGSAMDESFMQAAQFFLDKLEGETLDKSALIEDSTDLKALASLHESLEWMTARLREFITKTRQYASDDITQQLSNLALDYHRMSEICLLCIHIEVRLTCYYHLYPMFQHTSYDIRSLDSMEHDNNVARVMKDIDVAEENLNSSLQSEKHRYVFDGVGSFIAAILITGAKFIKRISAAGIKKMCRNIFTMQQQLSNITSSREANLDMARQYYEMLHLMPDDLQAQVVEQGVRYNEDDYVEALNLIHRSKPGSGDEHQQRARVQRLRAIVREHIYKKEHAEQMQKLNQASS